MATTTTTETDTQRLKNQLGRLPIATHFTTPYNETLDVQKFPEWSLYDFAFDDYMNISTAGCQVICNETPQHEGFINSSMAREILCGMYKQKSIVLLHAPIFGDHVDDFSKSLIKAKLDKIYVCDLLRLDETDLKNFLTDVSHKVINYGLSNHELRQISDRIHDHLRQLKQK